MVDLLVTDARNGPSVIGCRKRAVLYTLLAVFLTALAACTTAELRDETDSGTTESPDLGVDSTDTAPDRLADDPVDRPEEATSSTDSGTDPESDRLIDFVDVLDVLIDESVDLPQPDAPVDLFQEEPDVSGEVQDASDLANDSTGEPGIIADIQEVIDLEAGSDGSCECDDFTCSAGGQMCQLDTESADYCTCVNVAPLTCPAASRFTAPRDATGPLIARLEYSREPAHDATCEGLITGSLGHAIAFDYADPTSNAHSAHSSAAFYDFQWAASDRGPMESTLALEFSSDATAQAGHAIMSICFLTPPDVVAVQIQDQADDYSNVACGTLP